MLPVEVLAKLTFGEYGLYSNKRSDTLVCDNALFITVTGSGAAIAEKVAE